MPCCNLNSTKEITFFYRQKIILQMKKFIFIFMFLMITVMITTSINVIGILNGSDSILKTNNSPTISSTVEPTSPQTNSSIIGKNRYTVILDAGHGGKAPGSIGPKGTLEKDVALAVTLKVGKILEEKGYNVICIRKDDNISWTSKKEELLNRAEISNKNNGDIFVSIHVNSSKYENVGGTETYYHQVSSRGKNLAKIIQSKIVNEVNLRDRGIKPENFSILRNVDTPTVIIELAYISNPKEESLLASPVYQTKFAQAIASGINEYFQ